MSEKNMSFSLAIVFSPYLLKLILNHCTFYPFCQSFFSFLRPSHSLSLLSTLSNSLSMVIVLSFLNHCSLPCANTLSLLGQQVFSLAIMLSLSPRPSLSFSAMLKLPGHCYFSLFGHHSLSLRRPSFSLFPWPSLFFPLC